MTGPEAGPELGAAMASPQAESEMLELLESLRASHVSTKQVRDGSQP